jgi:hypothetical protein
LRRSLEYLQVCHERTRACRSSGSPAPVQVVSAVTHVTPRRQDQPYFTLFLPAQDHSLVLAMDRHHNGSIPPRYGFQFESLSRNAQDDTGYNAQNNAAFAQVSVLLHIQSCARNELILAGQYCTTQWWHGASFHWQRPRVVSGHDLRQRP